MLDVKSFKAAFFDRDLARAVDRGTRLALSKFGSFVRRRDKSSLKYRRAKSAPGAPPSVHRSERFTREAKDRKTKRTTRRPASPLRELTFFAYSEWSAGGALASASASGAAGGAGRSVVIGPALFRGRVDAGSVPRVIEEGGVGTFRSADDGSLKRGVFEARPHTGPAFRAELPRAPALLKDKIR